MIRGLPRQKGSPVRPPGPPEALETRRRIAVSLLQRGHSLTETARMVGCHPSSVMRWRDAVCAHGEAGLKSRPNLGRPPKLTRVQMERLLAILLKGAMARGYSTELWTTRRIAGVIEEEFGVVYHRNHVPRLMHAFNWSFQRPERRAVERDEEKIERWKHQEWPRIKKGLNGWVPTSFSSTNRDSC